MIDEIVRMEKKIFPKHESLARSFDEELKKRNSGLLYSDVDGDVAGYVMYSWPSSLCASITKLAGSDPPQLPLSSSYCYLHLHEFIFVFVHLHDAIEFGGYDIVQHEMGEYFFLIW